MEVILQSVDRGIFSSKSKGLVENECGDAANTTFPEGKERLIPMKTTMKTLAMLTLSTCVIIRVNMQDGAALIRLVPQFNC
jgi:hypothetical protein